MEWIENQMLRKIFTCDYHYRTFFACFVSYLCSVKLSRECVFESDK